MIYPKISLGHGKEKPLARRHPWVFSGAFGKGVPGVEPGEIVDLVDSRGQFLAHGYYNAKSAIRARLLSFDPNEVIDASFWRRRVAAAVGRRALLLRRPGQTACRLIMSEADRLPGLIVDQYGDILVMQVLTAGIDRHLGAIMQALVDEVRPRAIVERSDDSVRELEGLPLVNRVLFGSEADAQEATIQENGLTFHVDLKAGHKTGYYLDQRENHQRVRELARGLDVLDCFSYTGGFALHAAAGGAKSVLSIDASEPALTQLRRNLAANGLDRDGNCTQAAGNAFELLRGLRDSGKTFDMIVLDPPKFAASGAQVEKAARGYKDINMIALKMLRPGGFLATFSCSGHISADLFQKIVFGASRDADRDAQIIAHLSQADDHPVLLSFPESYYLKGLLMRAVEF